MNKWMIVLIAGLVATGSAVAGQHMKGGAMSGPGERMMEGAGQASPQGAGQGMKQEQRQDMHQSQQEYRFRTMDQDGDGYITRTEAQNHERLQQNWRKADGDGDGRVDQSEFSAWERE